MKRAFFLAWLLLISSAHAASFDCKKAVSYVEKLICDYPEISRMDELLATTYRQARKSSHNPAELKAKQRTWLVDKRNKCNDPACLKAAYSTRIRELAAAIPGRAHFELAPPVSCRFTLNPVWQKALSGRPTIGNPDLPAVYVKSVKLIEIPGQQACAVLVSGNELVEDLDQPSCGGPFDTTDIWHEEGGRITSLLNDYQQGTSEMYRLRNTKDDRLYYLAYYTGDRCFPGGASLQELKHTSKGWSLVAAKQSLEDAFEMQCPDTNDLDSCLGASLDTRGLAPENFIHAHQK